MSTPGGEELDEGHPGLGRLLEVVLVEFHHGGRGLFGWLGHFPVLGSRGSSLLLVGVDEVGQISDVPGAFVSLNLATIPVIFTIVISTLGRAEKSSLMQ